MTHVNYFVVRFRLSEISFVLKAIATLVVSMKKAPASKGKIYTTYIRLCRISLHVSFLTVNKPAWDQLIGLYPYLVDCTTTTSPEVSRSLREALLQYTDLLQAPRSCSAATSNDNVIQSNGQE